MPLSVTGTLSPPPVPEDRSTLPPASGRAAGDGQPSGASPSRSGRREGDRFTPSSEASRPGGGSLAERSERAGDGAAPRDTTGEPLSEEEQQQVEELRARDREVRQHEQAHKAAAGQYATSGPTYSFQQGPDGRRYAVGGEVGIDTSEAETPEATIRKMQQVRRAALAPAEPSAQDRRVASQASQSATAARAELSEQRRAERSEENGEGGAKATDAAGDAAGAASSTAVEGRASAEPSESAMDRSGVEGVEGGVGAGGGAGTPGAAVSDTAKLKGREAVGRLVNVLA